MFHNSARDQRKSGRGTVERRKRRRWRMRPTVVVLEDRRLLSTFTVTNTRDSSGAGSLRLRDRPGEYSRGGEHDRVRARFQHAADDHPGRHPARAEHTNGRRRSRARRRA